MSGMPYAVDSNLQVFGGLALPPDPIGSDGIVPRKFWVSPNGTNGSSNGRPDAPFLTITFAVGQCVSGRGDTIYVGPGSYAETVDVDKSHVAIIGTGGRYNGVTQIVGDGTTARATVRVAAGFLRGFRLANIELDVTTVTQPALHLATNDTGASPSATASNYRFLVENVAIRSDNPDVGFLFEGATLGIVRKCFIQGPTIGMGFTSSPSNTISDLDFEDIDFRDCVTADLATVATPSVRTTINAQAMTNCSFLRLRHWDRGGTPVTNYVNFPTDANAPFVNTHFFDCYAARAVADGTLLQLPVDVMWIGKSTAANFIVGA